MPEEQPITFHVDLEHGGCVGVRACEPVALRGFLHPEERRLAEEMPERSAGTWSAGRVALREALRAIGGEDGTPLLANDRGAPVVPSGFVGSVSHKSAGDAVWAVALAAVADGFAVGVDVELLDRPREHIGARVLTRAEQQAIAEIPDDARWREILIRFSAKEAVYKAIDPFLRRYVGFREVEVWPDADGRALVRWAADAPSAKIDIQARWLVRDGLVITTARASMAAASP